MGVPEKGITLAMKEKTAVHANLLDCGDCIQDIYVCDVWNMDTPRTLLSVLLSG